MDWFLHSFHAFFERALGPHPAWAWAIDALCVGMLVRWTLSGIDRDLMWVRDRWYGVQPPAHGPRPLRRMEAHGELWEERLAPTGETQGWVAVKPHEAKQAPSIGPRGERPDTSGPGWFSKTDKPN